MLIRRFQVVGRKLVAGSAGLLLGWTGTGMLAAQPPMPMPLPLGPAEQAVAPTAAPVQRNYLNKTAIQLPIQINEQSRSLIAEIQLFVKDGPNAAWTQRDKVGPSAMAFTFQVPRDGEYWFAMVTMDKQGRGFPSDLRNEPPGLVVVIDTQLPEIELTNLGNSPNGHLIQVDVRDSNPDNGGTRFYYQGGDKVFRMLDQVSGRQGVYCIPSQAVFTGVVRATAVDLAGNQAMREVHVNQMTPVKAAQVNSPQTLLFPPPPAQPPQLDLKKPAGLETARAPIVPGPVGVPEFKPINDPPPVFSPKDTVGAIRPDYKGGARVIEHKSDSPPNVAAPVITPPETLKRQFVNSTKLFLDYQIENAAQNSVAKVEVWVTRDRAKTWQKISEQAQHKSPVEVTFPGEGIFGVTLVATNSRGVPGAPPAAGDAPDMWVEVDTTKPNAQFTKVHATTEDGKAVVHIHWTASDQNLGDAPVELSYSATPVGPWQPIARGLKAEGQHRWMPPTEVGAKAYFRLSVRDAAGNTTVVGTQDAVVLEEPAPPRAIIRGISTNTTTPPPSLPSPPTLRLAPGNQVRRQSYGRG